MAASYGATTFLLLPSSARYPPYITRKRMLCLASSTPISSTSKLRTKRKNYIRPKILKTLSKPHQHPLLPDSSTTIPVESPLDQQLEFPSDQLPGEELKEFEAREEVSTGYINGGLGKFSKISVVRIGLYLVGAFVFQTICAVWILGSADSGHKDGILDSENKTRILKLGLNGNSNVKHNILVNDSGIVYFDKSGLEEKIAEIQAMASEVRRKESMKSQANNKGLDDEDIDVVKTGIDKEVDSRLIKLRKSLKNSYEKPSVGYLGKDRVVKDGLDVKKANGELMFKKKYKFKSPSISSSDKPKGFQSSNIHSISKMNNGSAVSGNEILEKTSNGNYGTLDNDQRLDLPNGDLLGNDPITSDEGGGRKAPVEKITSTRTAKKKLGNRKERAKLGKAEPLNGTPQDGTYRMPPGKAVKLGESSKIDEPSSPRFINDQATSTIANKGNLLSRDGSLTGRKAENEELTKGVWNKKSVTQTDSWWLTLPNVLAIFMRTGPDEEGPHGAYTIKTTSHTKDESSHLVAFEDRGDVTNFCYILQSFFEELEDFSTDIVPIPTNDLDEAVKSHTMTVLVVKKGQLRLYAGQPLSDVEMALRSMVGQS